jgi:hypothetical protein
MHTFVQLRGDSANIQHYTVQCVLVINIFNEKIFVVLWLWYCLLIVITAFSLLEWLWLVFVPYSSRSFIENHLQLSEMPFDPEGGGSVGLGISI